MTNQFYLTLPSNTDDYPDNTTSVFRTKLPHRIALQGDWEIALSEIIYPHSWHNVMSDQTLWVHHNRLNKLLYCIVPTGYYKDEAVLCAALNESITNVLRKENTLAQQESLTRKAAAATSQQDTAANKTAATRKEPDFIQEDSLAFMHFQYNEPLRRVTVRIANPDNVGPVVMSEQLKYVLGFRSLEVPNEPGQRHRIVADYPADLRGGFYAMYVYCDLVEQQVVGNTLAQLLRTVSVDGDFNSITTTIYNPPHYVPLLRKEFDQIEINIKDDSDRPIRFEFGKIIMKLHLRRKKIELF